MKREFTLIIVSQGHLCDLMSFWNKSHGRVAALVPVPPAMLASDACSAAWHRAAELTCCLPREHKGCLAKRKKNTVGIWCVLSVNASV